MCWMCVYDVEQCHACLKWYCTMCGIELKANVNEGNHELVVQAHEKHAKDCDWVKYKDYEGYEEYQNVHEQKAEICNACKA